MFISVLAYSTVYIIGFLLSKRLIKILVYLICQEVF